MKKKKTVIKILTELSGISDLNDTDELQNDLGFDSLLLVTLLIELEDVLQITLDESDMDPSELLTVSDVIALAERY